MAIGAYRDSSQTTYNGAVIFGLVRIMPGVDLGAPTVPITTNGTLSGSEIIPNDGVIIRNGNTAATNFNPFTANINTQRGKQSGYCTLNPLRSGMTLSNGNLRATSSSSYAACTATIGVSTGKFYYETLIEDAGGTAVAIGVGTKDTVPTTYLGAGTYDFGYIGTIIYGNDTNLQTGLPSLATGDTVGVAMNLDNSVTTFYKNGVFVTTQNMTSGIEYYPALGDNSSGGQPILSANFGQKPFKFPPPAGFQPLALANTPRPTIVRPDKFMGVVTYTGNGGTQTISGLGFSPDLVWIKRRDSAQDHNLYDAVRGSSGGYFNQLVTNSTAVENNNGTGFGAVTALNADGFTLGSSTSDYRLTNASSSPYVAWCWNAGDSTVTNNDGSITSQVRANVSAGFSIVTYTGTRSSAGTDTVGHGLGFSPALIISKARSATSRWCVQIPSVIGSTQILQLNTTGAATVGDLGAQSVPTPTSTTFGTAYAGGLNESGVTYVAYCFAAVAGYSSFGSYTGNGSADGPFVFCNFRPRYLMIKRSSGIGNWVIYDSVRLTYNASNVELYAESSGAEIVDDPIDILSNGFKIRNTGSAVNGSANTYVFAAFAESPSFNLYGGQSNAR
jgi:hypothetical protein